MTEPAAAAEPETKAPPPASAIKRLMPMAAVIIGGLVLGGASGMFAAGPVLARMTTKAGSSNDAEAPATSSHGGGEGESKATVGDGAVTLIDNLVMNPAGSNGLRFLLVTVGLQMKNASASDEVKTHDAEVRDAILSVLGSKPVEELANVGNRDGYKKEVIAALDRVLGARKTVAVFFPQFVIQ